MAFMMTIGGKPQLMSYASVLLYRALGPTLPTGLSNAASLWGVAQIFARNFPEAAARAGFDGPMAGNALFQAILKSPSGVVFADAPYEHSWAALKKPGQRINLAIPELLDELTNLDPAGPPVDPDFPYILSAGERRSETSNTNIRDTDWIRKGKLESTLRVHPGDAKQLGLSEGARVKITSRRASVVTAVEISDGCRPGHVSLPNGHGLDAKQADGRITRTGVALNELTDYRWRDPIAGTPWHKYVPVRLEAAG